MKISTAEVEKVASLARLELSEAEVEHLSKALNRWLSDTGQLQQFEKELAAAKVREEELRALGYIE